MKGILFKPPMMKAIVEGRKTVTRRRIDIDPLGWELSGFNEGGLLDFGVVHFWRKDYNSQGLTLKPRYQVGETVYIKEAWQIYGYKYLDCATIKYSFDGAIKKFYWDEWLTKNTVYGAGGDTIWRSPMFLREKYARYFITITAVRADNFFLPLISPEELDREGGEQALDMLAKISGKWVWVYSFKKLGSEV